MRFVALLSSLCLTISALADNPISYLPANTDAILTIHSREIAQKPLLSKVAGDLLRDVLKSNQQAADAVQASGIDPMKDVEKITIGLDIDQLDTPKPFILLEGKFDPNKIAGAVSSYLEKNPGKATPITLASGKSAYRVPGAKPEETMYTAILDDGHLLIAGSEKDIEGAFVAVQGRKPVISADLSQLLKSAPIKTPIAIHAWVKGKLKEVKIPNEQFKNRVMGLQWATATIDFTTDITVEMKAGAPDEAAAKQLSEALGGVVYLGRLQVTAAADEQPILKPVVELLRTTKVTYAGPVVIAKGGIKGASLEKALNTLPEKK
jgi:hypothetical protein